MTPNRRLHSSTRTLVSYIPSLAILYSLLTTVPARNLVTISTTSTAASSTSANTATNVTDVSPELVICRYRTMTTIWRRGDDFVDIGDMLFDELDLSWLLRRLLPLSLRQLLRWPLQRPGRLLRLQLRPDHENEALKSSRRGGRRLLVVVILRLLAHLRLPYMLRRL